MKINLKNLKGMPVFEDGKAEPSAKVVGVDFLESQKRIGSIRLETLSLVPLKRTIMIENVSEITTEKVVLKPGLDILNLKRGKGNSVSENMISRVVCNDGKSGKIKNMQFDFETGEIFSFEIGKGFFRKNDKISINKMEIKDNIIYVE